METLIILISKKYCNPKSSTDTNQHTGNVTRDNYSLENLNYQIVTK